MTDDIWSPSTAARGTAKEGSPHSTWFTVYLYGFGCSVFCFSTLNFSKVVNIVHSLEFRLPPRKLSWKKKAGQWFSSIENVGRLSESGRCYSCNKEGASFCPHLLCDDLKLQMTFGCDTWLRYTACDLLVLYCVTWVLYHWPQQTDKAAISLVTSASDNVET